jgi:hypothetical protein
MAEVRVFNPSSYTPRSYFTGEGEERRTVMSHRRRHHHRRHRRSNPFGISSGVVKDAAFTAAGALGSLWLSSMVPNFSTGWAGVAATGGAAVVMGFGGKFVGGAKASEELLKGGLTATIIKALHELGVAKNIGLGLYAPSWFGIPTASDQYLRAGAPGSGWNRGAGAIFFPGPAGRPALPPAAGVSGFGYHRFRSRYAGNYGG